MVVDLRVIGWQVKAIARVVKVDETQIGRWCNDPNIVPSVVNGDLLEGLHRRVLFGKTPWTDMLDDLRAKGVTSTDITLATGISRQKLSDLRIKPEVTPRHDTAEALRKFHRRICK
ncbi:MAG: hypothetical protein WBC85_09650 [Planktotalea sp.]|uniref:hypothetical protein n=1 Tax=Planktotalea sp. TaxID=2029877 RepID=UPI003C728B7C